MNEVFEEQSKYHVGWDIAKQIQDRIVGANQCSHLMNLEGIREWWLYLQDIDRAIAPRIKTGEHRKRLDAVRVQNVPLGSRTQSQYPVILFYRKKLTAYQVELEFLRDKLGLGFKPGDDPRGAISQ